MIQASCSHVSLYRLPYDEQRELGMEHSESAYSSSGKKQRNQKNEKKKGEQRWKRDYLHPNQ